MFATGKTMEEPFSRDNVHRWLAVLVKRAEANEFVALWLKTNLLADETDKVGCSQNAVSVRISLGDYHEYCCPKL